MNWTLADAEKAQSRTKKPATAPKPQQRAVTLAAAVEAHTEPENAQVVVLQKSKQHYVGPYQLAVANGTHYPGRSRVVIVGPACEELTAALVAALESFTKQPK